MMLIYPVAFYSNVLIRQYCFINNVAARNYTDAETQIQLISLLFNQTPAVTLRDSTSFLSLWFSDCRSFIRCSAWPSCASSSASSSLLPSWNSCSSSWASWQLWAGRREAIRQRVETERGRRASLVCDSLSCCTWKTASRHFTYFHLYLLSSLAHWPTYDPHTQIWHTQFLHVLSEVQMYSQLHYNLRIPLVTSAISADLDKKYKIQSKKNKCCTKDQKGLYCYLWRNHKLPGQI